MNRIGHEKTVSIGVSFFEYAPLGAGETTLVVTSDCDLDGFEACKRFCERITKI